MKDDLKRKIPVNFRTVLFCLCASGVIAPPLALLLHAFGYESPALPITGYIPLIALAETVMLPLVALSLARIDPLLTRLGLLLFLFRLLGVLLFPTPG